MVELKSAARFGLGAKCSNCGLSWFGRRRREEQAASGARAELGRGQGEIAAGFYGAYRTSPSYRNPSAGRIWKTLIAEIARPPSASTPAIAW